MALSKVGGNQIDTVSGDLTVDTNTLKVDAANNRVGAGTASPSHLIHAVGSDSTNMIVAENATGVKTAISHGTNDGRIGNVTNHGLIFTVNNAEKARITTAGQFRLQSAGITFNNDTAAANQLDDYEQGSYTPSFSFTGGNGTLTTAAAVGSYTKIGNRVHINFYIKIGTLGTASGDMRFSGLPYTPASVSNRYHSGSLWMNTTVSDHQLDGNFMTMLLLSPGDATIRPYFMAGGGGVSHANSGDVQNNTDFAVSMSYDTE